MTSENRAHARQTHDGHKETSFIEPTGTSPNGVTFQPIATIENSSTINEPESSDNQVASTSVNDDGLQLAMFTGNLTNTEPESENQVALSLFGLNINRRSNSSSGSVLSVSTEGSVESNGRHGQLVPHAPNEVHQLDIPQHNAPRVSTTITGNGTVNPSFDHRKNYYAPVSEHNHYHYRPSEPCCGCESSLYKHCIAGVTIFLLGITIFIFAYIWFSLQGTTKQLYVPIDITSTTHNPGPSNRGVRTVSRTDWLARQSLEEKPLSVSPVKIVIIVHTGRIACYTQSECADAVKSLQEIDMDYLGKTDISYNWLVGGDGLVYTGRGWGVEGGHTRGYDNRSIGIAFIGNFEKNSPTSEQIDEGEKLIRKGVDEKWIEKGYRIFGQKQCIRSNNPGETLYNVIKDWPAWSPACF